MQEQFGLNIIPERLGRNHSLDIGNRISERRFIDGKSAERLDPYLADISLAHFVRHNGNHSSDGSLNISDIVSVKPYEFFQILIGVHQVFAYDDVHALASLLDPRAENGSDIRKDTNARGCENYIRGRDLIDGVVRSDGAHVADNDLFLLLV